MKKLSIYAFSAAITLLMSCRDESLNPNKAWEPGVHGLAVFDGVTGFGNRSGFAHNAVIHFFAACQ